MAKLCSVRVLVGLAIGLLIVAWGGIFFWAVTHKESFSFIGSRDVFSFKATLVEYRSAIQGLTYNVAPVTSIKDPTFFQLGDLLGAWNPDDTSQNKWTKSVAHPSTGNGLARFDYADEAQRKMAQLYRENEVPFIVTNVPELHQAIANEFAFENLQKNLAGEIINVEKINSNNYMFYHDRSDSYIKKHHPGWQRPQEDLTMTFEEFVGEVTRAEMAPDLVNSSIPLYYFTISAVKGKRTPWIRDSLPMFSPTKSLFMVEVNNYKGINCRFGMKGVAAAAHYDGGRNFVAMLRGRKRYMLMPPSECPHLELYPHSHPSARHSSIDWSNIELVKSLPHFYSARATEVVLSMGEMLYIPGNWFHYIVSQDASIQCNSRSGMSDAPSSSLGNCYT